MSTKLWQNVLENSKASFKAKKDDDGKILNLISNNGIKKNGMAFRARDGEYTDFSVKVLEDVKPLLTDYRISKAIKMLDEDNIQGSIKILHLENEVNEYGIGAIYFVLKLWLEKNDIVVPQEYIDKMVDVKSTKLIGWTLTTRSEPLNAKIQIINIGQSKKKHSVVPEDWLGREFNNARELHQEMDNLDWRKGKPPVHYCCTYSMMIKETNTWINKNDDILNYNPAYAIIFLNNSKIIKFNDTFAYSKWINELSIDNDILRCIDKTNEKYIIVCNLKNIKSKENKYNSVENVGVLVSRLQKSIRRGKTVSKLLYDTINDLSTAKPYNLPEQQFVRVSGTRQLCWRLFITIIEDVEPYLDGGSIYFGLLDIMILALIAHHEPDIQFNEEIIKKLAYTALLVQYNDCEGHNWDWRKGKEINNINFDNDSLDYLKLSIKCMPMMSGDLKMLKKSCDVMKTFKLKNLENIKLEDLLANANDNDMLNCKYASNDMHCYPNILIHLQSSLPFIPYNEKKHSTYGLSSFIWEKSSRINIRNNCNNKLSDEDKQIFESLTNIQKNDDLNKILVEKYLFANEQECEYDINNLSNFEKRVGFLLLFGKKIRLSQEGNKKSIEIIVCGDRIKPCKIKRNDKYLDDKERFYGELRYVEFMNNNNQTMKLPNPPEKCKWNETIFKNKIVNLNVKLLESNKETLINKLEFYVNGIKIEPFDIGNLLIKNGKSMEVEPSNEIIKLIKQALYFEEKYDKPCNEFELNKLLRYLATLRNTRKNFNAFSWIKFNGINDIVWKCVKTKLYNNYDNEVTIGPVDRTGNKLNESINYLYEGTLLRIFNLLSFLYPSTIIPKGQFKFQINKNTNQYNNLLDNIDNLAFKFKNNSLIPNVLPIIKTKLWPHQEKSSNEIFNGITNLDKKGYGDASSVGSGKTLTALSIINKILNYNIKNNVLNHTGFLILLPTTKLYKTWKDEISEHTIGFEIIEQNADGKLTKDQISINSIVITTLGRMRDHPIFNSWILVVIDECLSVQNKEAFQTEEAFRQILCSQYGVIMMSATFFRSRFDKLYYMIKMLRSGLPENKDYLDTLLNESIICNISNKNREWKQSINRFTMDKQLENKYNEILNQTMSSEQLYVKLNKLLNDEFDYVKCFENIINNIEKENRRALIYAKSKNEAEIIAKQIKFVTRYPDKSGKHTILSYAEGTYGLNDLTIYDTIITRPPVPDALPQMFGRLDRPNQSKNTLFIEYLLVKNTIEEAGLLRLELCNNFYKNHIMPLAEFYDLAIGRKKINDIKNNNIKILMQDKKNNIILVDDESTTSSDYNEINENIDQRKLYIDKLFESTTISKVNYMGHYIDYLIEIKKMSSDFMNDRIQFIVD